MNWLERLRQRQYQLAQGVDADLVRYNQKRYKLAFGLLGFALLLGFLVSKVHLPDGVRLVVVAVATVCGLAGFLLAAWARQEAAFLSKPDPEEPPKILK